MILDRLNGLLTPCVEALGYELADLELKREHRGQVLRLFIDQESGIALDDCELVSGQVSVLLDVEDPIPGALQPGSVLARSGPQARQARAFRPVRGPAGPDPAAP